MEGELNTRLSGEIQFIQRVSCLLKCQKKIDIFHVIQNAYDQTSEQHRHGHDRIIVGFTTTYAITAYHR
jgi:hypothetical protein